MNSNPAGRGGNQTLGIILIAIGALFFLGQLVDMGNLIGNWGWPFFIIIPGALLLAWAFVGGKSAAGLAIPGSIVTTVGLILFFQNATNHFESWAYAWGLIVAASGLGRFIQGVLSDNEHGRQQGWQTTLVGLGMFVVFGAFFELFIFNDNRAARYLVPLVMIGLGAWMLMRRSQAQSAQSSQSRATVREEPIPPQVEPKDSEPPNAS